MPSRSALSALFPALSACGSMDRKVPKTMPGSLAIGNEQREEAAAMRKVTLAAFLAFAALPFGCVEQLSVKLFLIAQPLRAVQNEGHSTVFLPIQERTICAPQKS